MKLKDFRVNPVLEYFVLSAAAWEGDAVVVRSSLQLFFLGCGRAELSLWFWFRLTITMYIMREERIR